MEIVTKTKKYNTYTKKQVAQIRVELKNETEPRLVIAKRLSTEWGVPTRSIYQKINLVARKPKRTLKSIRKAKDVQVAQIEKEKAKLTTTGIELTGDMTNVLNYFKKPTKVVMYKDHVRYYYN